MGGQARIPKTPHATLEIVSSMFIFAASETRKKKLIPGIEKWVGKSDGSHEQKNRNL